MKTFLLGISVFFICSAVQAQTSDGLFPELKKRSFSSDITQPTDNNMIQEAQRLGILPMEEQPQLFKEELTDEEVVTPQATQPRVEPDRLSERLAAASKEQKEKNLSGFFEIYPHNLQIVVPVVESMQFCVGQLTMENGTEYDLEGLRVSIKYGSVEMPYTFAATKSGESTTGSISMGGPACQDLMKAASLTVISCSAVNLPEEECKNKVKYVLK